MKRGVGLTLLLAGVGMCLPFLASAQEAYPETDMSNYIHGLQGILDAVRKSMDVYVGDLTAIGRSLAGFGALFYVTYRVWGHLARAESIDFFPLLRPFAIGLVLGFYPGFIAALDGILEPTVTGTEQLVTDTNKAIAKVVAQDSADWKTYVGMGDLGMDKEAEQYDETALPDRIASAISFGLDRVYYYIRNALRLVLAQVLQVLYEAAALCVNTLRTFELVLLAILGPLVLGLSTFDGFKHVLVAWLSRYINVFLWLPVANVFAALIGHIQVAMLTYDHNQTVASGQPQFGATDTAYLIFLLMGAVGYFCIPSITNHIINVFPSGGGAFQRKVSLEGAANAVASAAKVIGAAV